MKQTLVLNICSLFFTLPLFAISENQPEVQEVQFYFEPSVTVCQNSASGFLDCSMASKDELTPVKVQLKPAAFVNELEVWTGIYLKEFKEGSFQATFQAQVTLLTSAKQKDKTYEFLFSIRNSVSGASTYTAVVSDPSQLNFSTIQLPGIKDGNRTFLIGLSYGAAQNKNASVNTNNGIPTMEIEGRTHYVMGDLLIEKSAVGEINIQGSRPVKVDLWEDGVLPIVFKNDVSQKVRERIWTACKEWSSIANVKCQAGPYKNRQLVISTKYLGIDGGCWSMLGQSTYFLWLRRRMNIGKGCENYSTILHELGHAFGLGHEHQRPDRDNYVEVLKNNIADPFFGLNTKMNFSTQEGELLGSYDFLSIMHYSRKAGSKNGKDTILPRPNYLHFADQMGFALHLSELDGLALQKLYGDF